MYLQKIFMLCKVDRVSFEVTHKYFLDAQWKDETDFFTTKVM